jgi:hypothetical protein
MNHNLFYRLAVLLATLVLALGLANSVQAQSTSATPLLREALKTLGQADHDYKGHRAEAMKQIHLAIRELSGVARGEGRKAAYQHSANKIRTQRSGNESQADSDTQLRNAQGLLQQASSEVSGDSLQHVNAAIAQLNTALAIR